MPESYAELINKGVAAAKAGNPASARKFFVHAIRLQPKQPVGWWYYAIVAPGQKEKRKALEIVLKLDPEHAKARARLSELLERRPAAVSALDDFDAPSPVYRSAPDHTPLPPRLPPAQVDAAPAAPSRPPAGEGSARVMLGVLVVAYVLLALALAYVAAL
jgi:tetratricopeptide (TPR) repeat protein